MTAALHNEIDTFLNLMRGETERTIEDRIAHPRQGRVSSYNPATPHLIKVQILPEADYPIQPSDTAETDWIPYSVPCPGGGWGIYAPPSIGDQVSLIFQEHDRGVPICIARINDDGHKPPANIKSGEFFMLNNFGVQMYFKGDGSMYSTAPQGYTFIGNGTLQGNWIVTGTLTVDQQIIAQNGVSSTGAITATGDVVAGQGSVFTHLLSHVHNGVTTGGANTGPPVARTSAILRRIAQGVANRVTRMLGRHQ